MNSRPLGIVDERRFLDGGGAMGALIRGHDWAATPLGPPEGWPAPLRTAVRLMLTTNHPMFLFWGPRGICLYNDAYSRSLGPEKHPAILGMSAREAWQEIWPIIGPQIELVMRGDGATWAENALVPIDRHGRREDVYWTYGYSPLDDPTAASGVGGVLVLCTETTEQVLMAGRLRAAEQRWRQLFQQAPGFVCVLRGREHEFEFANPAYFTLVGRDDIVGHTVDTVMPWARDQGFTALLDGVYATGHAHVALSAPIVMPARDGEPASTRYLDFVYQPLRNAQGGIDGIFVLGSDVTERQQAIDALRESERRLRLAKEAADLGIHDYDVRADRIELDARGRSLWGVAEDEPFTYEVFEAGLHPDDVAPTRAQVERALDPAGDGRYEAEYRVVHRVDRRTRWVQATGRVSLVDGQPVRLVGTVLDITERKLADARRTEFLATLGHELRNPLGPIANSLQVLKRQPGLPEPVQKAHAVIDRQLRHMVRLLEDLLDVVRVTSGRIELRPEPVALAEVVKLALEAAAPQVERGGHAVEVRAPADPVFVSADPVRLSQVFSNLVINASKYSDAGSRIEVAIERADDGAVAVRVVDQGIGIEPAYLPRVFDMFSQAEPSLSRSQGGLGVGLSLAKGLTELHGGSIDVRSAGLGRGSEFVVRLPVLGDAALAVGSGSAPPLTAGPLSGRRVLVVDDNRDAALSLASLLELDAATVSVAGDGVEALRLAQPGLFDVVLLDIGLPGLNGYEVCRALRARDGGADLRVLALTGWGQAEDRAHTRAAGFNGHLVKPIDYDELVRAIATPSALPSATP
ncbi:MAG: ATP-binding protein [Burkholderiaceae bacterium]